jgi:hypothetical protein
MKGVAPDDVDIRLEFDQSKFVVNAIRNLITEGALGALLTGEWCSCFLKDWRSSLIVITTIPFALLSPVVWLWAAGQTINIMSLGGLALAVGVLVDEATVEIENIHSILDEARKSGMSRAKPLLRPAGKLRFRACSPCFAFFPSLFRRFSWSESGDSCLFRFLLRWASPWFPLTYSRPRSYRFLPPG